MARRSGGWWVGTCAFANRGGEFRTELHSVVRRRSRSPSTRLSKPQAEMRATTMTSRRLLLIVVVLGVVGALWSLFRPAPSDADRIRAVVDHVVAGAEAADVGDVLAPVSESFRGSARGHTFDKAGLRTVLAAQFLRRGPLFIVVGEIAVASEGDGATASFEAFMAESPDALTEILPIAADQWRFDVTLAREDGEWRLTGATGAPI